jgi:hypothetical protein
MAKVILSKPTYSLGRNGDIHTYGLEITMEDYDQRVCIEPIRKNGKVGRGYIRVNKDDLPNLILALSGMINPPNEEKPKG